MAAGRGGSDRSGPGPRPLSRGSRQPDRPSHTAASQADREAYIDLVKSAQRFFKHPVNEGGRRRRPDNEAKAEQFKTAAKLSHWCNFSHSEIAEFFGWIPAEGSDPKRESNRADLAGEYVAEGVKLLDEQSPGWRDGTPRRLRARAALMRRCRQWVRRGLGG